jgi:RNA methyltransferase, TrmH family
MFMEYNKFMENLITSTKNPYIKELKRLSDAKGRERAKKFLVEGIKCINEALDIKGLCEELIILNIAEQEYLYLTESFSGEITYVSEFVLRSLSSVKTPQSIIAVCNMKKLILAKSDGLYIVLDGVSDPGNMGAIIRTADAVKADAVFTLNESVDFLSPKVIRASMGSVFHVRIEKFSLDELIKLKEEGYKLVGADIKGSTEFKISNDKICLIIGNEAHGISEEIMNILNDKIKIPIYGKAESLNAAVAASILMYKLKGF